ncbi:MAG: potassium channel family protein [Lachnospiraceae bacterium]|nr:potassium channel family protein [Lachnospiraceae bacterium]
MRRRVENCEYCLEGANNEVEVLSHYNDGLTDKRTYRYVEKLHVDKLSTKLDFKNLLIGELIYDDIYDCDINIENCIVIEDVDTDFALFNGRVSYAGTIFLGNCEFTGNYNDNCSFENTSFLGKRISFNESDFHFVNFQLMYAKNSDINFFLTYFECEEFLFNDTEFVDTKVKFEGTVFKNVDLFNFIGIESNNEIIFNRVNFDCTEIRWFKSNIHKLAFVTCEFQCKNADFEMSCEMLILHEGMNAKIMNFQKLQNLKQLDMCDFVNLGRINWNYSAEETIRAFSVKEPTVWGKRGELHIADHKELEYEYKFIKDIYVSTMQYENQDIMYCAMCRERRKGTFLDKKSLYKERKLNPFQYILYQLKHGVVDCFIEDFMSCYATSIMRVLMVIVMSIILFALIYTPVIVVYDVQSLISKFLSALYYSGITFFTIGYAEAEFTTSFIKVISIIEGFSGVFLMSYLTAVFVRKLAR